IDCDYSNVNSYGYLPSGSYTFTKNTAWTYMARNYPSGSYIKFFYSDTTTAGQASPTLCSDTQYAATITSFEWTFANSPGGTPSDGPKYLYARLYDENGIFLAEDKSSSSQLLTIDSDLLNGIGGLDSYDSDKYFYLQNGSLRQFNLIMVYPDSVGSVNYTGSFPADKVSISTIEEGPAWQTIQNQGVIFEADWDNTNGAFEVNTGVLGSNTGLVAGPPTFTVGIVTVQALSSAISTTTRYYYGNFDITAGLWADYTGATLSAPTLNDLSLRIGYLGDIADPDSSHGTIPNMVPCPDGVFGIDDIVVFSMAWNGIGGTQDPIADLAPYSGTVPDIWSSPDGNIDVQDLMAFTMMFDWYQAQDFSTAPRHPSDGGSGNIASVGGSAVHLNAEGCQDGDRLIVTVYADDVEDLMSAELNVRYDEESYSLSGFTRGGFIGDGGFFRGYEHDGGVQLYLSSLNRDMPGVSGSGELATLEFTVSGEAEAAIEVVFDLRNSTGGRIESGSATVDLGGGSAIPGTFVVDTAYPNPFNPSVTVPFGLPEAGMVEISVYDVQGRELYSGMRHYGAGNHRYVFDASAAGTVLSGGVYFLKVRYNDQVQSQKIVLMK
ncbi:MAG TPA: T9SS type A sorting domain-containing protein, partial [Bacteroidetes bacterium]|nr:T9SS type A sorting domain-containing protein [Bacteroidota bacterium]